jgi:hypothetical protein
MYPGYDTKAPQNKKGKKKKKTPRKLPTLAAFSSDHPRINLLCPLRFPHNVS